MTEILDDILHQAVEEMAAQMEYEILGAWRAGYDFLHVYDPVQAQKGEKTFAIQEYIMPSYSAKPVVPDGLIYRGTYDLRILTPELVREVKQHGTVHPR